MYSPKILQEFIQENIEKKNLCPPPESLRGGAFPRIFAAPPPKLHRRGTILRGGTVPPEIAQGGTHPTSPPVSALVYDDIRYSFCIVRYVHTVEGKRVVS